MATKRMVSLKIIDSDAFMDMSQTAQLLYFHLAMRTDDDGFIGNPKKIMRMIGSSDDDLKILLTKNFIIGFQSGVIVIKHHRMNNNWDSHNCKRTQYLDEFSGLFIKENGAYTLDNKQGLPVQTEIRLKSDGNQSLEENRIEEKKTYKKDITTKVVGESSEEFNYADYLNTMKEDSNKAIQLIRVFFMEKKLKFKTKKEVQFAITRNIKEANTLMKTFEIDDVIEAIEFVKDKYPDIWTLETLSKYLINHRITK